MRSSILAELQHTHTPPPAPRPPPPRPPPPPSLLTHTTQEKGSKDRKESFSSRERETARFSVYIPQKHTHTPISTKNQNDTT